MFRFLSLLALALSLAFACLAGPNDLPVIRNEQLGFGRQFHNRYWTPLRIDIDNPGPDRNIVLVIEPASRNEGQSITFSKPVFLPANSRRSVWLTVLPEIQEAATAPRGGEVSPSPIAKVFLIKLTDGGLKVWSQYDVMGKFIPENTAVMLVADSRLTSYRTPAEISVGPVRRNMERISIPSQDLPPHAADYDGISVLVLGNPAAHELHTLQRDAVMDWVHSGGTAVFVPGPATTNDWFASWNTLLPVDYTAGDRVATEPLLKRWGSPSTFRDGLHFQRMLPRDGETIVGDPNNPFLAIHSSGLGYAAALPLDSGDYTFQKWAGVTNFNAELMLLGLRNPPPADRALQQHPSTDSIVSSLAGIKVLGRTPTLVYLALLAGLMMAVLYGFRLTRYPERGWVAVAALAVVTGGIVIVAADRWKGQPQPFLNEIDIVNVSRDGSNAVASSALGLYSPVEAKFDFTINGTAQVRPQTRNVVNTEAFAIHLDDQTRIPNLAVRASDVRPMYGQAQLPAAAYPRARSVLTASGLEVIVDNPSSIAFTDGFFKFNRFVVPLGDLPPGSSKTFHDLQPGTPGDDWHFTKQVVKNSDDELRTKIRRLFFPDPVYTLGRPSNLFSMFRLPPSLAQPAPHVYGWENQPLFPLQSSDTRLLRRAVGLWSMDAPLSTEGSTLKIPRGLMNLHLRNLDARTLERAEGRFSGTRGTQILADFTLPPGCPTLRPTDAKVVVAFRGTAFHCRVDMQSPGSTNNLPQIAGKSPAGLSGGPVYTVPDPNQWFDPAQRIFSVAVTVEPNDLSSLGSSAVNYWQIRELDMEIGGTVP